MAVNYGKGGEQLPSGKNPQAPAIQNPSDKGVAAPVAAGSGNAAYDLAQQKLAQLKQLRSALDAGQIQVQDFISQGRTLATEVNDIADNLTSQGQKTGQAFGEPLFAQLKPLGFDTWATNSSVQRGSDKRVIVKLPEQYQQQVRESLIPSNITGEMRERLLKDIPYDIDINSDRYDIEREGVRQRIQQEELAATQKTERTKNLGDLAQLLGEQQTLNFKSAIPTLAEEANTRGIYRSTGFGDSLAREYAKMTADSQNQLAQKALAYNDLDASALNNALGTLQSFQSQGLNREFSLDDYTRQLNDSIRIAQNSQAGGGKSGTDKAVAIGSGVLGGLQTGAQAYSGIQTGRKAGGKTGAQG